jgi:hypothetical protein
MFTIIYYSYYVYSVLNIELGFFFPHVLLREVLEKFFEILLRNLENDEHRYPWSDSGNLPPNSKLSGKWVQSDLLYFKNNNKKAAQPLGICLREQTGNGGSILEKKLSELNNKNYDLGKPNEGQLSLNVALKN